MIQRIQSLYLFLIAVTAFLILFTNPNYAVFKNKETGKTAKMGYTTTVIAAGEVDSADPSVSKWINVLVLIFIGSGSAFAIFTFKRRDLQKKLCIYTTLLSALLIIFMVMDYNTMKTQFTGDTTYPSVWSVFPLIFIILGFMAWRGIRKDEAVLKSMDRIR